MAYAMTAGVGAEDAGRRFLLTVGVRHYQDETISDLTGVTADVEKVRGLFRPMGYETVMPSLSTDPTADEVRRGIDRWTTAAELGPRDVVLLYFAGHGVHSVDRHYLLFSDTERGLWDGTALASEDFGRPLVRSAVGHLLIVLDTCFAGAGTADITSLAASLARTRSPEPAGRWLMAAARGKERATENAFVSALTHVLAHPKAGARQEFVSVRDVTRGINGYFAEHHPAQHARYTTVDSDGHAPFFPNPAFLPGLPANDLDVRTMARLRQESRGHFDPRGRGVGHAAEAGDFFRGRRAALASIAAWLAADTHDRRAKVVTGDPGSGKSAVLGRVLRLSDPEERSTTVAADDTLPPGNPEVLALHARRRTCEELTARMAAALALPTASLDELLQGVSERQRPLTVVIDALDEAGPAGDATEAKRVARELCLPLSTLPAVRLLIGTRRPVVPHLGRAVDVLDLDVERWNEPSDMIEYASDLILGGVPADADGSGPPAAPGAEPDPARVAWASLVARGIAARAGNCFLVARMTARAVVDGRLDIDVTRPGWEELLPRDAVDAFDAYLDSFGDSARLVRRLLRPLAYAQGRGLPWSTVWAPVAAALSGKRCSDEDVQWLLETAGSYIIEESTSYGSAYRLFHESLASALRSPGRDTEAHRSIAGALTADVTVDPWTGEREWGTAHGYIKEHLAAHAAAGGALDPLLQDTDYLVHARPDALVRVLGQARGSAARRAAGIYRASVSIHRRVSPQERSDVLAIDAARSRQPVLSERFARSRPWKPRWATTGLAQGPASSGHTEPVHAVSSGTFAGRLHIVTASHDETVRVWELPDLMTPELRATLSGHRAPVRALATVEVGGDRCVLTGASDHTVRLWNLSDPSDPALLAVFEGHTGPVRSIAAVALDGRPHALTASDDGSVVLWDLDVRRRRATLTGHDSGVRSVDCAVLDGLPIAVTAGHDGTVRAWDLADGAGGHESRVLFTGARPVLCVAWTVVDGSPAVVHGDHSGLVRLQSLSGEGEPADGEPVCLSGHTGPVRAVSCTTLDGRPHAVTAADDGTVRVWDLSTHETRSVLSAKNEWVRGLEVFHVAGNPYAFARPDDHTTRLWDLRTGTMRATLSGRSSWVRTVTPVRTGGGRHLLVGGDDRTARVWDVGGEPFSGTEPVATFQDHTDWVRASDSIEVDGVALAVTGGNDGTLRVWEHHTGLPRHVLQGHSGCVRGVACAVVDGRPVAVTVGEDRTVRVWDVRTGAALFTLPGHDDWVCAVSCTTVGGVPFAVTAGDDATVRLWDLRNREGTAVLRGHQGWVRAVACLDVDGRPHAVTAGHDGTLRLWDLASPRHAARIAEGSGPLWAVASGVWQGQPHVVATGRDRVVRVWRLQDRGLVSQVRLPLTCDTLAVADRDLVLGMRSDTVVLSPADV
ncbi:Putative WD repeat-containing protein [Streptomyces venezuelae]|uniref:caspase family protein n=1 Tax=Streptomyces gardneri TaxID=66892 RepID=UPI0006BDF9FC|nr:caspase family protein [Streptomyces gardneri]ALO13233.1 Putative WD repeat-containing protein [Streptomyces venezuelae]QPK49894.1 caspase family protein [Streptomyces gardneri]WRK41462.1 caspase family protein [Streptomyces venezuelae]CUM36081.1 High-affnity carbon uptake protein Hat/HatR [Streptomyces venezuelae]